MSKKFVSFFFLLFIVFALSGCNTKMSDEGAKTDGPVLRYVDSIEMDLSFSFGERYGTYSGTVNADGLPDGFGRFSSSNAESENWSYCGQWSNGHFDGLAMTSWPDSSQFGVYSNDEIGGVYVVDMFGAEKVVEVHEQSEIDGFLLYCFENGDVFLCSSGGELPKKGIYAIASGYFYVGDMDESGVITVNTDSTQSTTGPSSKKVIGGKIATEETPAPTKSPSSSNSTSKGAENALAAAKGYLRIMPFSYNGLVDQLKFDGYSGAEAIYAADNCGAEWFDNAKKTAANYLSILPMSKSQLIEQLEFDGFTHAQAVYGAEENGY